MYCARNLLAAIIVLLICAFQAYAQNPRIVLNIADWPPFYTNTPPLYGEEGALVKKVFDHAGIKMEYKWYKTWKDAFNAAKFNREAGSPGWACFEERVHHWYISHPLSTQSYVLFHRKDKPINWETADDFKKIGLIGLVKGYNYGDFLNKAMEEGKLKYDLAKSDEANLLAVIKGYKQAAILEQKIGYAYLKDKYGKHEAEITHHPKPVRIDYGHLLLNKKVPAHKQIMEKFNTSLLALGFGQYHPDFAKKQKCVTDSLDN